MLNSEMASKKKIKKNHASAKLEPIVLEIHFRILSVVHLKKLDKLAVNFIPIQEHKGSSSRHWKSLPLEEPDVSRILKTAEANQLEDLDDSFVDSPHYVEMWCPKELKRSPRDITELDVVLAKFEKIAATYRQSIESKICRKAIDDFHSAFKDQITDLIAGVQELKNMKKKNAKAITNIKKKRPQLLQVRDELIGAEQQLKQLQREYAELRERKSSLRQTIELITDLKELQQDCLDYLEENPKEKVVYGTSSLPALLVESQRILGAEGHFESINMKLEEALAVQKGQKPQKN
ncbi:centromere protein U [Turdus rufiventris]|nr:centromere protein U [Turdus rufiventris]